MTVAARREREQQLRRETILNSARKLFKEKGFDFTTVDEIAALSELGKGTIYSYFKSKDQIYIAILEEEFQILEERMSLAVEKAGSAVKALDGLYETFIQYNRERRGFIEALFVQVDQQTSVRLGDLLRGLKNKSSEWTDLVAGVLQKGIDQGEFAPFEVNQMAEVIIGMILGLIIQSEMGRIKADLSVYKGTLFRLAFEGIVKKR